MSTQKPEQHGEKVLCETPFLQLVQKQGWVFARRPSEVRVVALVAVTEEEKVLLVEQFRVPVDGMVIELPAGLAGDSEDPDETLEVAAMRELLEETGYEAGVLSELETVTSSAGLTSEQVIIFRATTLRKVADGGGVEGERITVHEVSVSEIAAWLKMQSSDGKKIDSRVYAALHWVAGE